MVWCLAGAVVIGELEGKASIQGNNLRPVAGQG